jgi:hypothetical protein
MNAFVHAASRNNLEFVAKTIDSADTASLYTALWNAVKYNYEPLVRLLLGVPRAQSVAATKNNACLIKAVENDSLSVVKMLLDVPDVAANAAITHNKALMLARINMNTEMMDLLKAVPAIAAAPSTADILEGNLS